MFLIVAIVAGISVSTVMNGNLWIVYGAIGLLAVVPPLVLWWTWKQPVRLKQTDSGVEIDFRKKTLVIPTDCLIGYSSSWEDVHYKGIYQTTRIGLEFHVDERDEPSSAKAEPQFIAFDDIMDFEIKRGKLRITTLGSTWATVKESVEQLNFFPGYAAIQRLMEFNKPTQKVDATRQPLSV